MKHLLLLGVAVLMMVGCSDSKNPEEQFNPYRPIADLVVPREVAAGGDVILQGKGFAEDAYVFMQLNGSTSAKSMSVTSIDATSLTFSVPSSFAMGFYSIILQQNDARTTIGGINVVVNNYSDADFELYALSGEKLEVYPVSVSKRVKDVYPLVNSSLALPNTYFGSAMALPNGKCYYTGFDYDINANRFKFWLGCYDVNAETNATIGEYPGLFAIGDIDGELHVLKTDDNDEYTLVKWSAGVETILKTFSFTSFGKLPILENDRKFEYHKATNSIFIAGNMGVGSDMAQVTFALNLTTGVVTQNGGNSRYRYWYAQSDSKLYCFTTELSDEKSTCRVYEITDPLNWNVTGKGATYITMMNNTGFECPVFSPISSKIYAVDDQETSTAVLTFDPNTKNFDSRKWVQPGVSSMFYCPKKN